MENPTKVKILNAAKELFIEHGFAGTSIGKIAKLAQVNHSLVFHHFTNKEKLWIEVKLDIAQKAKTSEQIVPSTDLTYDKFLITLIENCFDFYKNSPDLVRLLNWQRLESSDNPGIGVAQSDRMQPWVDAIKHYQETGDINKKLKPEFIISFMLAVVSSAALDPNIYIHQQPDIDAYIQFCKRSFSNGFK
ncbi:MAG: TetR/AcrR family transcriptional regulator [Proteobacteria bacterium]|nr:TetR/AcrR family transcriptional regulator [Pseudomonadota bacterium]